MFGLNFGQLGSVPTVAGGGSPPVDPPLADFEADPLSGEAPLSVAFTDLSTNTPTSWLWDFGDGNTSTVQNPTHEYEEVGVYDVSLTATNAGGSDEEVKTDYVEVEASIIYATWNPSDKNATVTLAESNRLAEANEANWRSVRANQFKSTGKWFFEITTVQGAGQEIIGFGNSAFSLASYPGASSASAGLNASIQFLGNGITGSGSILSMLANDVWSVAIDLDARKAWVYRNGVINKGDPVAGTNPNYTWASALTLTPAAGVYGNGEARLNCGQSAFVATPPAGYNPGWYE